MGIIHVVLRAEVQILYRKSVTREEGKALRGQLRRRGTRWRAVRMLEVEMKMDYWKAKKKSPQRRKFHGVISGAKCC